MEILTENSAISIGLAIILGGGLLWLSSTRSMVKETIKDLEELKRDHLTDLKVRVGHLETNGNDVKDRVTRIETKLDSYHEKIDTLFKKFDALIELSVSSKVSNPNE